MESASLKLDEHLDVPVALDHMWSLITDPSAVVSCMPGASLTGVNDDGSLSGTLVTKFGPTTVKFQGKVILQFDHDAHVGRLEARGGDMRGRTKAAAVVSFRLAPLDGARETQVSIDAVIDVAGGLAPFVRTGGIHLTRRMLQDFSANLSTLAAHDDVPGAEGTEPERSGPDLSMPKPISGFSLITHTFLDVIRDWVRRLLRHNRGSSVLEGEDHEGQ